MADLKGINSKHSEQGSSIIPDVSLDNLVQSEESSDTLGLKNPAFWYSGGFIVIFVLMAIFAEAR